MCKYVVRLSNAHRRVLDVKNMYKKTLNKFSSTCMQAGCELNACLVRVGGRIAVFERGLGDGLLKAARSVTRVEVFP